MRAMETRRVQIHSARSDADSIERVARALSEGAVVAVPTETVYGLAANAADPEAMRRLYDLKGRADDKPIARLLALREDLWECVPEVPPIAERLARRLWPGRLTLVLRGDGGAFVGFRQPDHAIARALVRASGVPVAATSANLAGAAAAETADEVLATFDGRIEWVLEEGGSGREARSDPSTVVRVDGGRWEILRQGAIPRDDVADAACRTALFICTGNICRSPMAEGFLRTMLALTLDIDPDQLVEHGWRLESAGTAGLDGHAATDEAIAAAERLGSDISTHTAQAVTPGLIDSADQVWVMTAAQRRLLLEYAPEARMKVALLDPDDEDIPDPYKQTAAIYERIARQIHRAIGRRVEELT
jgi:tRNA threonylcarbamoyl adenosine modification protein (Sua5/YciO/YrdC/YwlC family)